MARNQREVMYECKRKTLSFKSWVVIKSVQQASKPILLCKQFKTKIARNISSLKDAPAYFVWKLPGC